MSGFQGDKPFIGEVQGSNFWIMRRPGYRNGFRRILRGTAKPAGRGSIVEVEFKMRSRIFLVWAAFYYALVLAIFATAPHSQMLIAPPEGRPIEIVCLLLPIGLVGLGRLLSLPDESEMRAVVLALIQPADESVQHGASVATAWPLAMAPAGHVRWILLALFGLLVVALSLTTTVCVLQPTSAA
jgi:hypothetical protein